VRLHASKHPAEPRRQSPASIRHRTFYPSLHLNNVLPHLNKAITMASCFPHLVTHRRSKVVTLTQLSLSDGRVVILLPGALRTSVPACGNKFIATPPNTELPSQLKGGFSSWQRMWGRSPRRSFLSIHIILSSSCRAFARIRWGMVRKLINKRLLGVLKFFRHYSFSNKRILGQHPPRSGIV